MNYIEICREVRSLAAIPGSGPASVTNQQGQLQRIVSFVRDAWAFIQSQHLSSWQFLKGEQFFTLVPNKARYNDGEFSQGSGLPDQPNDQVVPIQSVDGVWINGEPLTYVGEKEWLVRGLDKDSTAATPTYWTYTNQKQFKLYPKPAQAELLQYRYTRKPQILTHDEDVPLCDPVWHSAITYKALLFYGDFEEAPSIQSSAYRKYDAAYQGLCSDQLPSIGFK